MQRDIGAHRESTPSESKTARSCTGFAFPSRPFVSYKGLLVGVALIILNCYLMFYSEPMGRASLTSAAPFPNVIFLLLLLTILNAILARVLPRIALSRADLIAVYVILSIQTGLSDPRGVYWVMGTVSYGHWSANPNHAKYLPHLPTWLLVTDDEALTKYYFGQSTLFTLSHMRAWLGPVMWWTLLLGSLGMVLIAATILFSQHWIRQQRLSFPIVELPFQMITGGTAFWSQRFMWLGLSLAAGAELFNGLHYLYPSVPQLPLRRFNIAPFFTEKPWDALGETHLSFYPFIIGLSFLMPLDLSMSLWIFYLLHKAQLVFGRIMGWSAIPNYPFTSSQQFGASAAIGLMVLWSSRKHLQQVWYLAWNRRKAVGDTGWSQLYRGSLILLGVGTVVVMGLLVASGLPWWAAFVVYGMYLFMGLIIARIRCELGSPVHVLWMNGPNLLMTAVGAQNLGMKNVTLLGLYDSFTQFTQNHIFPHQFEGAKLADRQNMRVGSVFIAMGLAVLVAVPMTFLIYLQLCYQIGAATAHLPFGQTGSWLYDHVLPTWVESNTYRHPNLLSLSIIAGSFVFAWSLMILRDRIPGLMLHPVGLALATSGGGVGDVVTSIFIGSLLKGLLSRYGGLKGYRTLLPFFLGLILGDLAMGMMWVVGGILFNTQTYTFFL